MFTTTCVLTIPKSHAVALSFLLSNEWSLGHLCYNSTRMMKKHFWKIVALVAVVLVVGSMVYANRAAEKANEGVTLEARVKGNPEAKVVLVEYSDFQCPACAQFYPYVKEIMEENGDDIRFEYRHFPLINIHPQATPAAKAAEAAGVQGKFWEMHDKLFENQNTWSKSSNPNGYFTQYAEELGLDVALFKQHQDASMIAEAVENSFNDARSQGFSGTPTFLLNGQEMKFETFDEFRSQIEAAITAAAS